MVPGCVLLLRLATQHASPRGEGEAKVALDGMSESILQI